MESSQTYLDRLTRQSGKPEAEIMAQALQLGLRELWRTHVLGRYLRNEIGREEAVDAVGLDWVDLAERQQEAMLEDFAWAMKD